MKRLRSRNPELAMVQCPRPWVQLVRASLRVPVPCLRMMLVERTTGTTMESPGSSAREYAMEKLCFSTLESRSTL